jgi:hypothetical protein
VKNKGGAMISVLKYLRKQMNQEKKSDMAIEPNSTFVYKSGSDVLATWKKQGWRPPSEYRTDYEFGKRKAI